MASPLFNAFGNGGMNNPLMNNFNGIMQRFNQFRSTFRGNPQEQVQRMLNSGQMSQEQFTQLKQMADQFQRMMK